MTKQKMSVHKEKITLQQDIQKAMLDFFLRTSIPKIVKEKKINRKP